MFRKTGLVVAMVLLASPLIVGPLQGASSLMIDLQRNEATIMRNQPDEPYFTYIKGTIPVLISAPHGARHFRTRENRLKGADVYTAAMAMELGKLTGAHVIYTRSQAPEDPNNDPHTRYKDFLAKIVKGNGIRFIMDLHGAHGGSSFTMDVGTFSDAIATCSCPLLLETIRQALSGLPGVRFNSRFSATGVGTVTYFAHENLGVDAAQFEINGHYRIPKISNTPPGTVKNEREITAAIEGLRNVIREILGVLSDSDSEKSEKL